MQERDRQQLKPSGCQQFGKILKQHFERRQIESARQDAWNAACMGWFKRHQSCPGLAALGHHDSFARMGCIDQTRELGLGAGSLLPST